MSNEVKIGILGIVALTVLILGYKFLSGKNIFSNVTSIYVEYENIDLLSNSTPVLKNGFQVGVVSNISIKDNDPNTILVEFEINGDIKFPKSTQFIIASNGLMGDKMVKMIYDTPCSNDCAQSGDYLQGGTQGLITSMIGEPEDMKRYVDVLSAEVKRTVKGVNDALEDPDTENKLAQSVRQLQSTIDNLNKMTGNLNRLIQASAGSMTSSMQNFASISDNLKNSNQDISQLISNVNEITNNLKTAPIDSTFENANTMIKSSEKTMESLQVTLEKTNTSLNNVNSLLKKMDDGEGNLGKLANDEQLYDNLTRTTKNMDLLLQDLRLNPKRYINVSVFGKKQKEYDLPAEDPAFEN